VVAAGAAAVTVLVRPSRLAARAGA
jgi:hypothetical protein